MNILRTGLQAAHYADVLDFNARDRYRLDNNFDLTQVSYEANPNSRYEFGYARKTRSPGIYELYLWIKCSATSVGMTAGSGIQRLVRLRASIRSSVHLRVERLLSLCQT